MSTTSISVNYYEGYKKKQKAFSYIDPKATSQKLVTFGQITASLIDEGEYDSTTRIDRTDCDIPKDTQSAGASFRFTTSPAFVNFARNGTNYTANAPVAQTSTSLTLYIGANATTIEKTTIPTVNATTSSADNTISNSNITFFGAQTAKEWRIDFVLTNTPVTGEIITIPITFPETDTLAETTLTFTINIT